MGQIKQIREIDPSGSDKRSVCAVAHGEFRGDSLMAERGNGIRGLAVEGTPGRPLSSQSIDQRLNEAKQSC